MRRAAAVVPLLLLAACVVIPIPLGEGHVSEGRELPPALLAAIRPGLTTCAEATATLGEPAAIWEEQDVLVWQWDRVRWMLFWAAGGYGGGAAGLADLPDHHMVLAQGAPDGVVRRLTHAERPLGEGYGDFLRRWLAVGTAPPGNAKGAASP